MAKSKFSYEKYQREMAKKKKQEEKRARKAERRAGEPETSGLPAEPQQ